MLQPLAQISLEHPSFFGECNIIEPMPLVIEEDATLLPRISTGKPGVWAGRWSQGIFDSKGNHIEALSDKRGTRKLFYPDARLENSIGSRPLKIRRLKSVIYGGTLYEHFGDMIGDANRVYQLLRLYRYSKQPIWFHYAVPRLVKNIRRPTVLDWIECLGLSKRLRLIRKPIQAEMLVSCPQIHCDLSFTSSEYHLAARAALHPRLAKELLKIHRSNNRIAYLTRATLAKGTTKFIGEDALARQLSSIDGVDIIIPEELSIADKLALWRRYSVIVGFPQSCMLLKPFVPFHEASEIARQIFLVAGPKCIPSTWLNIEKACGFGDFYLDCNNLESYKQNFRPEGFARGNCFDVGKAFETIKYLAQASRAKIVGLP